MKRLGISSLAVVLSVSLCAACRRSSETTTAKPSGTDSGAPAAPDLDGLQVELRTADVPAHMAPGSEAQVRIEVKNVGTKPWPAGGDAPLHFGYHWEAPDAGGNWAVVVWDDSNRAGLSADVAPGESAVVTLPVKAVANACPKCRLVIAPLVEMKAWSETTKSITPVNIS